MDYFTSDGVILRTGYKNKADWYLLPIREMLDNDIDFLWKHYKGSDKATISVKVTMDDNFFRVKISNSNEENIPVFKDLKSIFNYEIRYGSKQDVHTISRGMLGDAMKQILSLGYVLLHIGDEGKEFTDKQWNHHLIIRHNGNEQHIFLHVDRARQTSEVNVKTSSNEIKSSDTEIELVLPMIDEVRNVLNRNHIEQFCKKYSILTTDISFKFRIIDDINHDDSNNHDDDDESDLISELNKALLTVPEKGIINIDSPATHPISDDKKWTNSDSIWSYKPEEFIRRFENVHDKDKHSVSVYDVLLTFNREGSNVKKNPNNDMTINEFLSLPDKDQRLESFFNELRNALDAPLQLSLPYTTNTKKRCEALVTRIAKLYEIDQEKKPSYKLLRGMYNDGVVKYPFAFEIIAVPFKDPFVEPIKSTEIITAVNYSVSPIENSFEGEYEWEDKDGYPMYARNIPELIHKHGFHSYSPSKARLPSIIVANLITPRRDPRGHDKSSIDTKPFVRTIIDAVKKMSPGILTNRAAGYRFVTDSERSARRNPFNKKVNAKNLLKQFLMSERGLKP